MFREYNLHQNFLTVASERSATSSMLFHMLQPKSIKDAIAQLRV